MQNPPDVTCGLPLPAACSVAGPQPGSAAPRSWLTEQLNACSSSLSSESGAILTNVDCSFPEQHCVHHRRGHYLAQSLHTQSGDHRQAALASPGAGEKCTARGLPQTHWVRVCHRGKSTEDMDARSSSRSPPLAGLPRGHAPPSYCQQPRQTSGSHTWLHIRFT